MKTSKKNTERNIGTRIALYTGAPVVLYNGIELARLYFTHEATSEAVINQRVEIVMLGLIWIAACMFAGGRMETTSTHFNNLISLPRSLGRGVGMTVLGFLIACAVSPLILTLLSLSLSGVSGIEDRIVAFVGVSIDAAVVLSLPVILAGLMMGYARFKKSNERIAIQQPIG